MVAYFKLPLISHQPINQPEVSDGNLPGGSTIHRQHGVVKPDSSSEAIVFHPCGDAGTMMTAVDRSRDLSAAAHSTRRDDVAGEVPSLGGRSPGLATYLCRFLRTADRLSGRDINILSPTSL